MNESNKIRVSENAEDNKEFFEMLNNERYREVFVYKCKVNNISVKVIPHTAKINWKGYSTRWIVGYCVKHCITED